MVSNLASQNGQIGVSLLFSTTVSISLPPFIIFRLKGELSGPRRVSLERLVICFLVLYRVCEKPSLVIDCIRIFADDFLE